MEDSAELRRQGIEVDDNNDPAPGKIPQTNNRTTSTDRTAEKALNWNGAEGIAFPLLASNLPDTPVYFKNYSNKDVMKMSNINLFLILSPLDYLKQVVIPQTNKQLK